jgi:hypothetical protein
MKRGYAVIRLAIVLVALLALLPGPSTAGRRSAPDLAGKITFEEAIVQPDMVRSQYCNNPATNKGVEFLNHGGRIFAPTQTTSSPTHALTNKFPGDEFGEFKTVQIRFTTGQSAVSVQAGLERAYGFGVVAHMWAYSSDTPGTGLVDSDGVQLGVGPTEVLHALSVTSAGASIRSVEIRFSGPAAGNETHEVIDDLTYSTIGPPCVTDNAPPVVQISKPASTVTVLQSPLEELAFTVTDNESGVAKIQVTFLGSSAQKLDSFLVCGGTGPLCIYDVMPSKASYDFYTNVPTATKTIRVQAWDFANHSAQVDRSINLIDIGYFDLWAQAMEITQGIQPWLPTNLQVSKSGSPPTFQYPAAPTAVPLVANRTTVVRVYAGVQGTTNGQQLDNVRANLYCFSNSTYSIPCPGYKWISPQSLPPGVLSQISIKPNDTLDTKRRDTKLSWNFVLPNSWTQAGSVFLEAVILPPNALQECAGCADAANRLRVSSVKFETVPNFQNKLVHFVRTDRKLGGATTQPTQAQFDSAVDFLGRRFPVDEATLPTVQNGSWTYNDCGNNCGSDPAKNLGARCNDAWKDLKADFPNNANKKAVYALLDNGFPCAGVGGYGAAYGRANRPDSFPHEVGHAVGLNHAGSTPGHGAECNPWACDAWPWPHGTIDTFGFDVYDMTVVIPGTTEADPHDFMSYGGNDWVSSRNWIRMFNAFTGQNLSYPTAAGAAGAPDGAAQSLQQRGEFLLVRGQGEAQGGWTLLPMYEMELAAGVADEPDRGEHSIVMLGALGQVLREHRFTVPEMHADPDDLADPIALPPSFVLLLPLPQGLATVELRRGDEVLASVARSEHAPSVEIVSPSADGFEGQPHNATIVWNGHDDDGQPLYYRIQYSPGPQAAGQAQDEREWHTLASDWTEEVFPVVLDDLPGGQQAMVRVLASDGFNTTVATSPAFVVSGKAPLPRILSPGEETTVEEGERLQLVGTASDLEDGLLGPDALHWYADLFIPLGSGRRLDVDTLSPGTHLISLIAEDSEGKTGWDAVWVTVTTRPNFQPAADAGPDRSAGVNGAVRLDGSASADADGDPLSYDWFVADQPMGSGVSLSDAQTAFPAFSADTEGDYVMELVVSDGQVNSLPDRITIHVAGTALPRIGVVPVVSTLLVSDTTTVDLRIDNIENLYGVQVEMLFDPEFVEVVDAYGFIPGVQIEEGDFPVPQVVVRNQADNGLGSLQYAVSQLGEQPGVSGSGTLARITFHGLRPGDSPLAFTTVILSDPRSVPIEAQSEDGALVVREESGILMGRVILERRPGNGGAIVCVEALCTRGAEDGTFVLPNVPPGRQTVAVSRESYLRTWREVQVPDGLLVLPDVTLLAGDVNGDDHIEQFDAMSLGFAWNSTPMDPQWDGRADITDDGSVNILDMVGVQFNWDAGAPGPWEGAVPGRRSGTPEREVMPENAVAQVVLVPGQATLVATGETVALEVRVQDVTHMYGGRVQLTFDPAVIQVLDADPRDSSPGVQIYPGDFLDTFNQFVLVNKADNVAGTIDYAVTQLHPAEGRSGSGVLARIRFHALAAGSSAVHVAEVRLGDNTRPDPLEIPAGTQDGHVSAGLRRTIYLPALLAR